MYYTTVKYSSCYKELFFFYFILLKNISFKHLAHTDKKGESIERDNNRNSKQQPQ